MSLRKTKVDGCWKEIDLRGMKLIFQRQQSADATVSEAFSSELPMAKVKRATWH